MKWPSARLGRRREQLLANPVPEGKVNSVMTESKGTSVSPDDGDAISWLRTKLQDVEQRCNTVQVDLKKAQNECVTLDGNRRGLAVCLANQEDALNSLRQDLLRVTLANQSLGNEKIDLQRKLEERDRQLADLRRQLAAKDRLVETQRSVLEEASKSFTPALRAKLDKNIGSIDARRGQYREELQVAREALASLRGNFRSNDPNHHILDTLEQCMAFLMERVAGSDLGGFTSAHGSLETQAASKRSVSSNNYNGMHSDPFTKVVYFTDRTVTPYLSVIPRRLGDVTLRDFKTLFDRPGVYRFHFKAPDSEYGFVKEEIADDDAILPGYEGKIIAWVEETSI